MRITRTKLLEIVEQEVRAALFEKESKKKGKKPQETDAEQDPTAAQVVPQGGGPDPIQSAPPIDGGMNDEEGQDLDGDGNPDTEPEDPTDGEGPDDEEAIDADGTAGEEPSGAVNDELSGKIVQAITIEPKSKVLPGAKEVVLTFSDTTDALRVLITATGQVKFFWRGQLSDLP